VGCFSGELALVTDGRAGDFLSVSLFKGEGDSWSFLVLLVTITMSNPIWKASWLFIVTHEGVETEIP